MIHCRDKTKEKHFQALWGAANCKGVYDRGTRKVRVVSEYRANMDFLLNFNNLLKFNMLLQYTDLASGILVKINTSQEMKLKIYA